jgi:hypothetical protein
MTLRLTLTSMRMLTGWQGPWLCWSRHRVPGWAGIRARRGRRVRARDRLALSAGSGLSAMDSSAPRQQPAPVSVAPGRAAVPGSRWRAAAAVRPADVSWVTDGDRQPGWRQPGSASGQVVPASAWPPVPAADQPAAAHDARSAMVAAALAGVAGPVLGRSPALELDLVPASVCWLSVAAGWDLPPVPGGLAAPAGCVASGPART